MTDLVVSSDVNDTRVLHINRPTKANASSAEFVETLFAENETRRRRPPYLFLVNHYVPMSPPTEAQQIS